MLWIWLAETDELIPMEAGGCTLDTRALHDGRSAPCGVSSKLRDSGGHGSLRGVWGNSPALILGFLSLLKLPKGPVDPRRTAVPSRRVLSAPAVVLQSCCVLAC